MTPLKCLLPKIGFDTAANGPSKVFRKGLTPYIYQDSFFTAQGPSAHMRVAEPFSRHVVFVRLEVVVRNLIGNIWDASKHIGSKLSVDDQNCKH